MIRSAALSHGAGLGLRVLRGGRRPWMSGMGRLLATLWALRRNEGVILGPAAASLTQIYSLAELLLTQEEWSQIVAEMEWVTTGIGNLLLVLERVEDTLLRRP